MPDPLNTIYPYYSSYEIGLDITGCFVAGDGSSGPNNKDPRLRRCSFGIAILRAGENLEDCHFVGSASVPGRQTVPRAEAAALLHVLRTTRGDKAYICDNLGFVKRFKSLSADLSTLQQRLDRGDCSIEIVWMPSHTSYEEAANRGYPIGYWLANHVADSLVSERAQQVAMSSRDLLLVQEDTKLSTCILRGAVAPMP